LNHLLCLLQGKRGDAVSNIPKGLYPYAAQAKSLNIPTKSSISWGWKG
jgi:hypothetical protein